MGVTPRMAADFALTRDFAFLAHIILGIALIALPLVILLHLKKKSPLVKPLSALSAAISWILLYPAGQLYLTFYPATKTLIKAGAWPWAHDIFMETKEHWGILLPVIATVAAFLVYKGKAEESRKWWMMVIILSIAIAVMGRIVKMGAGA